MGSDVSEFLRQIPLGPVFMFCGSGILIVVALVAIIQARSRRDRIERQKSSQIPAYMQASDMGDLPDLDMLVNTPVVEQTPYRAVRKGTYSITLSEGGTTEAVEVMTIMRDVVDGSLVIQMGDKSYRGFAHDEAFKASFMKVMRELGTMVKSGTVSRDEPASHVPAEDDAQEPVSLHDLVSQNDDPASKVVEQTPKPTYIPPPTNQAGAMPGDLPNFSLADKPLPPVKKGGLLRRGKLELEPIPELDIAGAIEAYLQHKLKYTPDYTERSIHVHPAPGGGVSIEVDGRFYDAVSDVAEPDIREFLSATIQEWQQRN